MLKYTNKRRWPLLVASAIAAVLLITGGVFYFVHKTYQNNLKPVSSNQKTIVVTIPKGSTLDDVAGILKQKGIIRSDWAFTQYVRNKQASDVIKAGTYDLSPSQSVEEIVSIITQGKIKTNLITILPGQRLDQVKKAFINSGYSESEVNRALNPALYKNHPALSDGAALMTIINTPANKIRLAVNIEYLTARRLKRLVKARRRRLKIFFLVAPTG